MDALRLRGSPFGRFGVGGSGNAGSGSGSGAGPGGTQMHKQEPLIVVEESNYPEEMEPDSSETASNRASLDIDSPVNPYLLSPWRDPREARKQSLPSQQVTDGITASQVRRLSERGGEGSGPSPKEAAFLATLSQAPAPSGRRHSVVTISKVPTTLFGRSRRESVATYPTVHNGSSSGSSRVLNSRRESNAGPPSTDPIGSIHNLQLDIMDDIYLQSRKARLKLWTSSNEKVCEVQTVDEAGGSAPRRYTNRRYSECPQPAGAGGVTPAGGAGGIIAGAFRRASEFPGVGVGGAGGGNGCVSPQLSSLQPDSNRASMRRKKSGSGGGLLGSRTDIGSIFSTLSGIGDRADDTGTGTASSSSSAATAASAGSPFLSNTFQAAARGRATSITPSPTPTPSGLGIGGGGGAAAGGSGGFLLDPNAGRSTRSNSFDVSILNTAKQVVSDAQDNSSAALSGLFGMRTQPMDRKKSVRSKSTAMALSKDMLERLQKKDPLGGDSGKPKLKPRSKKKSWADTTKANIVDATILGTALEGFLRKSSNASMSGASGVLGSATGSGGGGASGSGASTSSGRSSSATRSMGGGNKGAIPKDTSGGRRGRQGASTTTSAQSHAGRAMRSTLNWFSKGDEDDSKDTCDASLCATLKDLFVK